MIRILAGLGLLAGSVKLAGRLSKTSDEVDVAAEFVDRLTRAVSNPAGRYALTEEEISEIRGASRHPRFNINVAWDIFFEDCLELHAGMSADAPDEEEMDEITSECNAEWLAMLNQFDESIRMLKP